jgi:hypothetical protein
MWIEEARVAHQMNGVYKSSFFMKCIESPQAESIFFLKCGSFIIIINTVGMNNDTQMQNPSQTTHKSVGELRQQGMLHISE